MEARDLLARHRGGDWPARMASYHRFDLLCRKVVHEGTAALDLAELEELAGAAIGMVALCRSEAQRRSETPPERLN